MAFKFVIFAALCLTLAPVSVFADPALAPAPAIAVTPGTILPGQSLRVAATGFTASNQVGTTFCVGLLGPGRNVELGLSPAFRPNLGMIAIGASGSGQVDVATPASLIVGSYQIVVGGCSPHLDIAPLAATASATIQVVTSLTPTPALSPTPVVIPRQLPATGGATEGLLALAALAGAVAVIVGRRLKRRR